MFRLALTLPGSTRGGYNVYILHRRSARNAVVEVKVGVVVLAPAKNTTIKLVGASANGNRVRDRRVGD